MKQRCAVPSEPESPPGLRAGDGIFSGKVPAWADCAVMEGMNMYEKDCICYADNPPKEILITEARPLADRMTLVTFKAGERRLFDTKKLNGPVFRALDDERIFRHPVIQLGTITWDDWKIDIAPETVYRESVPYDVDERGEAL